MKIEFDIDDEEIEAVFRVLGAPDDDRADIYRRYMLLATGLIRQWLLNEFRPERINEQHEEWLQAFFGEFHPHDEPSVPDVYGRFRFPQARAEYLVRRLRQRQDAVWREHALHELKQVLSESFTDADALLKDSRPDHEIEVVLRGGSSAEFNRVLSDYGIELRQKGQPMFFPPSSSKRPPDFVIWKVSAELLVGVTNYLEP